MKKLGGLMISFLAMIFLVATGPTWASELKFSVEPQLPDNQINPEHTYFDLKVAPQQKQTLVIHMRNDTDKDVVVEPQIKAATTNLNGVVEYGRSNNTLDDTAPYDIADIVTTKETEVTIPAKSSYDLELSVELPKEAFKGVLAGGITLQEKEEQKNDKEDQKQGLAIENKYAYVVAILLQESTEEIAKKLTLEAVKPNQVNARNVINATLKNPQATYINQLAVKATVRKKGEKQVLYSAEKESMQMAPNTSFDYPIPLNGEKLKPGKYTVTVDATASKDTWHFTKDFEIKADVAKKLNARDVTIKTDYSIWLYAGIGLLLLVIILLLALLLYNKKKSAQHSSATTEDATENE